MSNRRLGSDDGTVLFACSICGVARRYPSEMKYRADRMFQCFLHGDTTTNLEEARKQGQGVRVQGEAAPHFPIGPKPSYFP